MRSTTGWLLAFALSALSIACGSEEASESGATGGAGGSAGEEGGLGGSTGGGAGSGGTSGATSCGPVAAGKQANIPYATLNGVDPSLLSLDVYAPAIADRCVGAPTVVWVHGGGWLTGDKSNNMSDKVALFNDRGWLLISVNYRLSPNPPTSDPGRVMYPAHPADVAAALQYVHEHAQELGADPARIALLGHSAGAHLVALTTTDEGFLGAHGKSLTAIRCVGSFDTEGYDVPAALATASAQQQALLENAFGTDPTVQAQASPRNHVAAGKGIPPFLIATRGAADRKAIQEAFRKALADAGVGVSVIDATGLTHEQVNDSIGATGDAVMTPPLLDFLQTCFQ